MLCGLLAPTSGRLEIDGRDYSSDPQTVRKITGWVPDTPPLYEHLTGRQYIAFVGSLYGVSPAESTQRSGPFVESLGLSGRLDELCRGYSHGMRKKIHLAAVLTTDVRVLFLDEPTTGLDPKSARNLKDVLLDSRDRGTTIFLSTHQLDTAEEICDRVGVIVDGELIAVDTLDRLKSEKKEIGLEGVFLRLVEEADDARHTREPSGT